MNRERKFRVWNVLERRMYYIGRSIALQFGNAGWAKDDKSPTPLWMAYQCTHDWPINLASDKNGDVLMDWTGMKDRNGVEVFEGDVIRCVPKNAFFFGEVSYKKVIWGSCHWHVEGTHFTLSEYLEYGDCTVVGNAYENPKLLQS